MWLVLLLFCCLLGMFAVLDMRKPKRYPPGPRWWPIVGSALAVLQGRKRTGNLYKATAEMAEQYGPVIGLKVGKDLIVVVYGREALKEFLTSEELGGRPTGPFFQMRTWGERRGVLLTDRDYWSEQRRFILRHLREFGFGRKNMSLMIQDEAGTMVEYVRGLVGVGGSAVLDMATLFSIHILNTLWMMLAGVRYSPHDKMLKQLQNILAQLFNAVDMVGAPFSHFPLLRFVAPDFSGYSLYVKTHVQIWEFLQNELKRHKETYNPQDLRDFIDVYLKIITSPEPKTDSFCEQQLVAICLDMFMAGSETTSKTLEFGFLYLTLYPDVQKKAQEELDRVVGRQRLPSLDDRPNMPYMECVVLESLRMFAGRAFTVPHRALNDTYLNGYFIPKDTILVGNLHGNLMRPENGFPEPDRFWPERYMRDGKICLEDTYIPFGYGKRRCLGESLARANVFLFTATLLQHFRFEPVPDHPPQVVSVDGVTPGPAPYRAVVSLRP